MDSSRQGYRSARILLVSMLCLFGAGAALYNLYLDFEAVDKGGKGDVMATVEIRQARVRKKTAGSYMWSNVEAGQNLYRKDSVQTGPASVASIRLKDQSLLELGEDSLVVIDDVQNLSLNFQRGTMVLRGSGGGADKRLSLGTDGKVKVETLPVRLMKPEPMAEYFLEDPAKKNITFQWEPKSSAKQGPDSVGLNGAILQISFDRSFSPSRTQTRKIAADYDKQAEILLGSGRYYWRIANAGRALTEIRRFRVGSAISITPSWPNSSSDKIHMWKDESVVSLRWVIPRNVDELSSSLIEHRAEISKTIDFKHIVTSQNIVPSTGITKLSGISDGEFFWRVKSKYADVVVTSKTEKFFIEKSERLAIDLLTPAPGGSIEQQPTLRFNWASSSEGSGGGPSGRIKYKLELRPTAKSANQSLKAVESPATSYVWKNLNAGSYEWRVIGIADRGPAGESSWKRFTVYQGRPLALKSPKNDAGIYYWSKPTPFTFAWDKDQLTETAGGDNSYILEVSKQPDFTIKLASERINATSLPSNKIELESGKYFWRVSIVNAAGDPIKVSAIQRFNYDIYPPLKAPEVLGPEPGSVYDPIHESRAPVLAWAKVKDTEGYEVTLGLQNGTQKFVTLATTIPFNDLKEGNYSWHVQAIDPLKRRGEPSAKRTFRITYGQLLAAPEVLSPEVQ